MMERITCLQSIFSWKNKVKIAAADRVGTFKFGVEESSEKTARFEGSAHHEEASSPAPTYTEMRTHDMNGPREPLITAPSMTEWGKVDGTASFWSDNDQELEAAEAKKRNTFVTSVELDDFNFPNSVIVEEDGLEAIPQCAMHVDAGVEMAYEGGDEDEELAGALDVKECESDPSSSEGVLEVVAEETAPGHVLVNESTRYYETRSNGAEEFGGSDDRHFSDGEICVEIGNDYVSDPGVYNCKDMEMAASSPYFDAGSRSGHRSEDLPVVEMRSECLLSDLECGSQHVTSTMTGHQVMRVSCGSGSSAEISTTRNMSGVQATVKAVHISSSHSEKALRFAKDKILNMRFFEEAERQQLCRPWWKIFLFTHRNIHRRDLPGVLPNGCTGYGSEVDYHDNRSAWYPMLLQDQSFQDKTIVGDDKVVEIKNMEEHCVVDMSTSPNFDAIASLPVATSSSLTAISTMDTARDQKVYIPQKADLSRVEEWVSSINLANTVAVDEDIENDGHAFREPGSPTASATSFFSSRAHSSVTHQLMSTDGDGSIAHHSSDAEMAALIARSVNPLSTVAYFSGVGLRIIPPLALHNGLKTLNLSANHIGRIMPGLLPRSLHSLDLSRNKIVVIEGLRELTRLRVLNLSHNRISRIGHGLAGCSSLRELHLAGNKISEIEGLHRLLKLSLLDLSFNKLTTSKAISQLAANYNSLQALNLLGNPLHHNVGDEPLRKLVTGLAPHILYLNKQATKAVSARDAAVDSVARAALGTHNHHHTPRGSKGSRGAGLSMQLPAKASTSQLVKLRNREKLVGHNSLNMILQANYPRSSMTKETTHKQQSHQNHHHHHHHHRQHSPGRKANAIIPSLLPGSSQLHPRALDPKQINNYRDTNWTVSMPSQNGMNRIKSDGSLYELHGTSLGM